MRATWRVARAAVRRRKLQTLIIGVVVLVSTATIVLALGIFATVDKPYDQAFSRVNGAHLTVSYDGAKVTADQLAATGRVPGVTAAAGPFATAVLDASHVYGVDAASFTVVGRADQNGPVDRLVLTQGRWLAGPGEIVVKFDSHVRCLAGPCQMVGRTIEVKGRAPLTIVGVARSVTQSAGAWVTPAQAVALKAHDFQMLYHFADASTPLSTVTAGLPQGAVSGSQTYLVPKLEATDSAKTIIPFLLVFGALGLIVAVLIIGNVVSGAVVSGVRHIGVLKALGFTPAQVTGAYVAMVALPGLVGCAGGVVTGNLLAQMITGDLGGALDTPPADGVSLGVDALAFAGVLALVTVTTLVPALRAGRLSAAEAVSAGAAPRRGRALRVQRLLARTSLPRPVSLGLGLPFARPGRTSLTLAAVAFGVAAVTFACGLLWTVEAYQRGEDRADFAMVVVDTQPEEPVGGGADPNRPAPAPAKTGDQAVAAIRSLPATVKVAAAVLKPARAAGVPDAFRVKAYQDGLTRHGYDLADGRWLRGRGEAAVSGEFLRTAGKKLGDTLVVEVGERRTSLHIVAEVVGDSDEVITDWQTMSAVVPGLLSNFFEIVVKPGTNQDAYLHGIQEVLGERLGIGIRGGGTPPVLVGLISVLTLGLAAVAGLGVFNTVVLNTRDRTRDFGILKSLGSTPRQIMVLVLTSMVALGLVGGLIGLPLGLAAHRLVMPMAAEAGGVRLADSYLLVFGPVSLAVLVLAGVAIGALGALIPAGWAGRLRTATALRSE
ncbi:MAG: ABC transporter permease [Streptosporangiaceae bacterium]